MKTFAGAVFMAGFLASTSVFAGGHITWNAVEDESRIAFGSIKKDTVGEVHHFNTVSGMVKEDGMMELAIDLGSLETNIDIRNERMAEHVFKGGMATATITGAIDMEELTALKAGETALIDFEGSLAFAGANLDIEAEMHVARLTEDRVLVSTADFIMVSTEDLGINAGVDELMKLAKLPGITRVTPVAVRVVFQK